MTRSGWIAVILGILCLLLAATVLILMSGKSRDVVETAVVAAGPAAPQSGDGATESASDAAPKVNEVAEDTTLVSGMPHRVGECAMTTITTVGARLVDGDGKPVADSGSSVELANGVYGVSYVVEPALVASRVGDLVRTCLVSVPDHCPPGDDRGKMYRTTNQRTNESWELPDAQHRCGGA